MNKELKLLRNTTSGIQNKNVRNKRQEYPDLLQSTQKRVETFPETELLNVDDTQLWKIVDKLFQIDKEAIYEE